MHEISTTDFNNKANMVNYITFMKENTSYILTIDFNNKANMVNYNTLMKENTSYWIVHDSQ